MLPGWARNPDDWITRDARGVERRVRWTLADNWSGLSRRWQWRLGSAAAAFLGVSALAALQVIRTVTGRSPPDYRELASLCAVQLAAITGLGWSVAMSLRQRSGGVTAAVARALAARRCPSCAHDLAGTPTDRDALTICPECGAAWHARPRW